MTTTSLFEHTFDHAANGMAIIAVDGRFLRVNASLSALLGYSQEEMLALDFQRLSHPDDLGEMLANLGQLIRGEVGSFQLEKRCKHKDGHYLSVFHVVTLAREIDQRPRFFVDQVIDITPLRQAEERARADANTKQRLYEELARSNAEVHQLQNQLLTVCAWTKRIRAGGQWQTIEDFLTTRLHFKVTHGISDQARQEFVSHLEKGTQPPKPDL
ncbi:putative PAS/PAC sensor protein [Chthoniobacter flavus Ellin428]|uniref:Putative PAS/PAC sensor protein n=1 Tax=Chthoniobacter flavus Ellin428 TaxID=497964 RepID=B4DBB4_9BACT|nr:PAS domain S-box protein [Chthoniobacter flavus]EDY16302.1 putative PAS/PAC sensor protein [Chthoniobacter flavus Ellin428]TCO84702.1 PAS domain S-box-containing protein [Chthoniobacter flavus]